MIARFALMVCLGAALVGSSSAVSSGPQDADKPQARTGKADTAKMDAAKADAASRRARWNKLSKAEQAELLARHKRLESLSPKERAELESRAKRVHREMAEIEASLNEEELVELDKLGSKERRDALRKMVAERAAVAAEMVRTRMTPKERTRIEAAKPEERAEMLRVLRERELERLSSRLLDLGGELGMSKATLEELRAQPHEKQRAAIISRARNRLERAAAKKGLPPGLSEERWKRIQSQDDMGFLRGVERIRSRHPEFGVPAKQWDRRQRRRAAVIDRLDAMLEPTDECRASFPNLAETGLRRRMIVERRRRIEHFLGREFRLSDRVMDRLRALKPMDFVTAVGAATNLIPEGGDVNAGLDRWLDGWEKRRGNRQR